MIPQPEEVERNVTSNSLRSELPAPQVPGCVMQPCSQLLPWKAACEYPGETEGVWSSPLSYSARHTANTLLNPKGRSPISVGWNVLLMLPWEHVVLGEKEPCGGETWMTTTLGCYDIRCLTHVYYYEVPLPIKQQMKAEFYCVLNSKWHLCQILKSIFSWNFSYTLVFPSVLFISQNFLLLE